MENVIELSKVLTKDFKDRDKAQIEKFYVSLSEAEVDNKALLDKHNVTLSKCSQFIVLAEDKEKLTQSLELGNKMGFIDAYRANPRRLTQDVTKVINRMAKCDAIGIPYKKEDGRFENFIFSGRGFNAVLAQVSDKEKEIIAPSPTAEIHAEDNNDKVKEYALRVLEQFAMTEMQDDIYKRLDEIKSTGLGTKEMLMEAFKVCSGNTEILSSTIDELLENEQNVARTRGGIAA